MKVRDSGMPNEEMWSEFFDPQTILEQMQLTSELEDVVDLGSGYGIATMWEAVFGDMGVALIAIFNALRILKK